MIIFEPILIIFKCVAFVVLSERRKILPSVNQVRIITTPGKLSHLECSC